MRQRRLHPNKQARHYNARVRHVCALYGADVAFFGLWPNNRAISCLELLWTEPANARAFGAFLSLTLNEAVSRGDQRVIDGITSFLDAFRRYCEELGVVKVFLSTSSADGQKLAAL